VSFEETHLLLVGFNVILPMVLGSRPHHRYAWREDK